MHRASFILSSLLIPLAVTAGSAAGQRGPLQMLSTLPRDSARANTEIVITFDRPIAATGEGLIDPARLLAIEPRVEGRLEWRDNTSLRFVPSGPLTPGALYRITLSNAFSAADGTRLAHPYEHSFRIVRSHLRGVGSEVTYDAARSYEPHLRALAVYSGPVDDSAFAAARIEFDGACRASRSVAMRVVGRRSFRNVNRDSLILFARVQGDPPSEAAWMVVELREGAPLPKGCHGTIRLPTVAGVATGGESPHAVHLHGDLGLSGVHCDCTRGPIMVSFATPVAPDQVQRYVRVIPEGGGAPLPFRVDFSANASMNWRLPVVLTPRTTYDVVVDTALRDAIGRRLTGRRRLWFQSVAVTPSVSYSGGHIVAPAGDSAALSVQHVNVDSLLVTVRPVPDSLAARAYPRYGWERDSVLLTLTAGSVSLVVATRRAPPDSLQTTSIDLEPLARAAGSNILLVTVIDARDRNDPGIYPPLAVVQITELGLQSKLSGTGGWVWVTTLADGRPVSGARVTLVDGVGGVVAESRSGADGLVHLALDAGARAGFVAAKTDEDAMRRLASYVVVDATGAGSTSGRPPRAATIHRRVLLTIGDYGTPQVIVPAVGMIVTDRDIYRQGEVVRANLLLRREPGASRTMAVRGDSVKWVVETLRREVVHEAVRPLGDLGTAFDSVRLGDSFRPGGYAVRVLARYLGRWMTLTQGSFRVVEYRVPEFIVTVQGDTTARVGGGDVTAEAEGRYSFGEPMRQMSVSFAGEYAPARSWELRIPREPGEAVGQAHWWNETVVAYPPVAPGGRMALDTAGRFIRRFATPRLIGGYPVHFKVTAGVEDVSSTAGVGTFSTVLYPASIVVAVRDTVTTTWRRGVARAFRVRAIRLDGTPAAGVRITGALSYQRRQVSWWGNGQEVSIPPSAADTVARCEVISALSGVFCDLTPPEAGNYSVTFRALDEAGRSTLTHLGGVIQPDQPVYAAEFYPRPTLEVATDTQWYSVGDTARISFESAYDNAAAWMIVERAGEVLDQRRLTVSRGRQTIALPLAERHLPGFAATVVLVPLDGSRIPRDSVTIRWGVAGVILSARTRFLGVEIFPGRSQYRPGDSARLAVRVRDSSGVGVAAAVTLWAVDEAVLAMSGYRTPTPFRSLFDANPRSVAFQSTRALRRTGPTAVERRFVGLGGAGRGVAGLQLQSAGTKMAFAAALLSVVVADSGTLSPSEEANVAYRSSFVTTPAFLTSIRTDGRGRADTVIHLPGNLTTFRIIALAAASGDRFGSGDTSIVVTKTLLARAAVPRFVRAGDTVHAGVMAQDRSGSSPTVNVAADARGASLLDAAQRSVALADRVAVPVRFRWAVERGDSVTFRTSVSGDADSDGVVSRLPVRPDFHPRAHTVTGALRDTATVVLRVPADIDPARSRLVFSVGMTTMAPLRWAYERLRAVPYWFTDCIVSDGLSIVSLLQAERALEVTANVPEHDRLRDELREVLKFLADRQLPDGRFGIILRHIPSTWLTARVGSLALAARDAGVPLPAGMLERISGAIAGDFAVLGENATPSAIMGHALTTARTRGDTLDAFAVRVVALDFLDRAGRPNHSFVRMVAERQGEMRWEDRVVVAGMLARAGDSSQARTMLGEAWRQVSIAGNRVELPDSVSGGAVWYSRLRPATRLLFATLAIDPSNPGIGALAEMVARVGQAEAGWAWSTTDYGEAAVALAELARTQSSRLARSVRATSGERVVFDGDAASLARAGADLPLAELLSGERDGVRELRIRLSGAESAGVSNSGRGAPPPPVYFSATVHEVPLNRPVTPDIAGLAVERWYERVDDGRPVTSVVAGDLVRVRVRVSTPTDRFFVSVDDMIPAGLEPIDLSLKTSETLAPFLRSTPSRDSVRAEQSAPIWQMALFGSWSEGWWSPWDHRELYDDRVVFFARVLWAGSYTGSYVARATTPGTFVAPPAHAEEVNNPALHGRTGGGTFVVRER